MTCHISMRYGLLMETKNEKFLILNEPTNYRKEISNFDYEK